jgi:hypothetical protein
MRTTLSALLLTAALATPAWAAPLADLHGVHVGMQADVMPTSDYRDFVCAGAKATRIGGWSDWKSCPIGAKGLHAMHVGFETPGEDDTIVAGHSVVLTLAFDAEGRLARIVIATKAKTSLYMRKKAFLLAHQAETHYGDSAWTCRSAKPSGDEEPIGHMFIKRDCSKTLKDRTVIVASRLYHKAGGGPRDFVSKSRVTISWRGNPK